MTDKITCEQCVRLLKEGKYSTPAKTLASWFLSMHSINTTPRAVATALRAAVKDGRVSWNFHRGIAHYRFKRLKAKGSA